MKESEIFEKAADGLERFGWTQGFEVGEDNRMCALGALKYGMGMYVSVVNQKGEESLQLAAFSWPSSGVRPLDNAATRLHRLVKAQGAVGVVGWNDDPKRTADEVITTIRHAAKFAKEDEDAHENV